MRLPILPILAAAASLALGGCAASIAASAVGAAVRAADKPDAVPTSDPGPAARAACTAEGERFGTVKIIDTEYKSASKLIVWGTVEAEGRRRSFECEFEGKLKNFKLRAIR